MSLSHKAPFLIGEGGFLYGKIKSLKYVWFVWKEECRKNKREKPEERNEFSKEDDTNEKENHKLTFNYFIHA